MKRARPHGAELLEDPTLKRVLDVVEARPGIPTGRLHVVLAVARPALNSPLDRLIRAKLILRRDAGRMHLHFPWSVSETTLAHAPQLALLLSPAAAKVARAIVGMPGQSATHLAQRTGLPLRTLHYQLHRLQGAGLIHSPSSTRYEDLQAKSPLAGLLAQVDVIQRDG